MRDEPDRGSGTLRRVLDALPPVAYWGVDLRNRFANAAFADLFAVSPEVAKGRHMSEVLPPDVFALALPYATRALAGEPQQVDRVEQLSRVVDEKVKHQAATSSSVVVSSSVTLMPSLNFTPSSTSLTSSWPLNRRQRSWAASRSL